VTNPTSTLHATSRPGPSDDSSTAYLPLEVGLANLNRWLGAHAPTFAPHPAALPPMRQEGYSWYKHLARTSRKLRLAGRALVAAVMTGVPSGGFGSDVPAGPMWAGVRQECVD
jgi:hypothetical protein